MLLHASEWLEAEAGPAFLASSSGSLIAANHEFARLIGAKRADLTNVNLAALVSEDPGTVREYLRLSARTRLPTFGALTLRTDGAADHPVQTEGCLLRRQGEDGEAIVLIRCRDKREAAERFMALDDKIKALSREIAARRRTEEERDQLLASERAARHEAERIIRIKDEFLATLSHELRTPLNAILGWTQILQMEAPSETELAQALSIIERNTRAQAKLIDDLLDMSRIISGKLRLDVQRVELASVLESAIESLRPAFEAKGIRLQKVLDSVGGVVMGDANRLQQVFWNLLSNAMKFTPKGGRVQVLLERVNSHVEVSVIDNGEGIKQEFLPHVFDRFQQADASTTRKYGGLGLGLAIVRHLVELHGGTVRAKSPGEHKGSTFIVTLPVTALRDDFENVPEPPAKPSVAEAHDSTPDMAGLSVLIVDDEPDSLAMAARVLTNCGCRVLTAGNADEAFSLLREHRPSVLVSDIGMPGEDGYSLIRRVRALPASEGGATPAIALTAFARSEDRLRAIRAGFQMHLSKPTESAELIAVVASVAGLALPRSDQ